MDSVEKILLDMVDYDESNRRGAINIRKDGKKVERKNTEFVTIESKTGEFDGLDVYVKADAKDAEVHMPVILTVPGLIDRVYNDIYVGDGAEVTIIAGCGLHNDGCSNAKHEGTHRLHIGKNAKVRYIEKHFGFGEGTGERIINPRMTIELGENSKLEIDSSQIKGIDSTVRQTLADLSAGSKLIVSEKIMTHGKQHAETDFRVNLDGEDSISRITSRSFVTEESSQRFISHMIGNNKCRGRVECDAMLKDNGKVTSIPEITANHLDAYLVHEATVGRIAGDQLKKLMSLGLTEKEAEEEIIKGFLK